jgi:hypothetical protein
VGLLGLVVTLGIVSYELRNTTLYDAAMHRAKWLEVSLDLPLLTHGKRQGGLFNERPPRPTLFEGALLLELVAKIRASPKTSEQQSKVGASVEVPALPVWHDQALALVYGAALGGWVYIVIYSLLTLIHPPSLEVNENSLVAILVAVSVAIWVVREWYRFDEQRDKPKPMAWRW